MGNKEYTAPEQHSSAYDGTVHRASDLWGVGRIILALMLQEPIKGICSIHMDTVESELRNM